MLPRLEDEVAPGDRISVRVLGAGGGYEMLVGAELLEPLAKGDGNILGRRDGAEAAVAGKEAVGNGRVDQFDHGGWPFSSGFRRSGPCRATRA